LPGEAGDAISLSIEFESDGSEPFLFFQFSFGSEEFVEFGGSAFNDDFTLELNGFNLARLSDGDAVNINNLAPSPTGQFHPDLVLNPANTGPAATQTGLDGFTEALTFVAPLEAGTNELSIDIRDVSDGIFDSAVMLKAGTFGTEDPREDDGNGDGVNELLGTSARDVLVGTDSSDRLTGFEGGDSLTGGGGSDTFVYRSIADIGDVITDFEPGSDRVDVTELLDSLGLTFSDAIGFESIGDRTLVTLDVDGSSPQSPHPFLIAEGVSAAAMSDPSNFVLT